MVGFMFGLSVDDDANAQEGQGERDDGREDEQTHGTSRFRVMCSTQPKTRSSTIGWLEKSQESGTNELGRGGGFNSRRKAFCRRACGRGRGWGRRCRSLGGRCWW